MHDLKKRIEDADQLMKMCDEAMEETIKLLESVRENVEATLSPIPIEIEEEEDESSLVHHIEVVREKVRV